MTALRNVTIHHWPRDPWDLVTPLFWLALLVAIVLMGMTEMPHG